jgi:preprotein translocase subunit SecG
MNWFRNKNNFYFIVIAVLIIVILLQKCGGGNDGQVIVKQNDTIRTVDTSYVTITKEILTYVPKWQIKIKYIQ